jgi:hypothetical protein
VKWTAPIATTFTVTADVLGKCNGQLWGTSYPRKICGQNGVDEEEEG